MPCLEKPLPLLATRRSQHQAVWGLPSTRSYGALLVAAAAAAAGHAVGGGEEAGIAMSKKTEEHAALGCAWPSRRTETQRAGRPTGVAKKAEMREEKESKRPMRFEI